jgi:hypothetical protein
MGLDRQPRKQACLDAIVTFVPCWRPVVCERDRES